MTLERKIVLVTRRTRLEELIARFHTEAQARFYLEHLGADFGDYRREHDAYLGAKRVALEALQAHGRWQAIERGFVPSFLFAPEDIVVALGQDGLVANIMKYLDGQPLVGVNPEPARHDGVLLPFGPADLPLLVRDLAAGRRGFKAVTMARARLPDGQAIHAVNDLFIGPRSHTSARYEIAFGGAAETQSSSGIIVSTGLGSTAWMKSIVTGAAAIAGGTASYQPLPWDAPGLRFAVREPFPSRTSRASLVFGAIGAGDTLRLRSLMPENGVIFSDGIEADYLQFNSGALADIGVADRQGRLVV